MKLLFLEIETAGPWKLPSVGPAFVASFIRKRGHEAKLLRVPVDRELSDVVGAVRGESPDIIGLSLTTRQWLRAREVVSAVTAQVDVPVIAGGLHPTFMPEATLAADGFDYVCLGEGEEAMLDLMNAIEDGDAVHGSRIPNIWAKGGERPDVRPVIRDLDSMPVLARDMLEEQFGVYHVVAQRGCPYDCSYCAGKAFRSLYGASFSNRRRSPQNVIDELVGVRESDTLNYVIFLDDSFTTDNRWVLEYCGLHAEKVGVGFSAGARVDAVTSEMLHELARAGCRHLGFGVESGSPRVRREIMRRFTSDEQIRNAFVWAKDAGILATANYIIGLPGETAADIEMTLALHERLEPDDFQWFVYHPLPGTRLFDLCRERGYLPDDFLDR
jgi:radical SAM superfamily enzyme YgiQ (UPF0313 family)